MVSQQNGNRRGGGGKKEIETHVATGKVTALKHEARNDTVESRALVALTLGLLAELTEVPGSLGDVLLKQIENDTTRFG